MSTTDSVFFQDIVSYGEAAMAFVRRLTSVAPEATQSICRLKNARLLYVLERLDQSAVRRLLNEFGCPFRAVEADVADAIARIEAGKTPVAMIADAHPYFGENPAFARELELLQQQFWTLVRYEAERYPMAAASVFGFGDRALVVRLGRLRLPEIRQLSRYPIAMRLKESPAFELAVGLEGQGATEPRRLAVAGMAAACHVPPSSPVLQS
ncbi:MULTISPECIES: hypothetical protein [unclassified Rhodanobacter]|uniref:hypothetical protein n=1 Tax=unclassified Rhodanobacter TaxID=2621553 RepID=UPI0007A9F47B|nr:hypothetical protein [Rhodanobacter sp. FW510-R10]KZC32651.1 hypothetical protein RhoFW510R10_12110 [Rhodanobacter sp. FW510-R10]